RHPRISRLQAVVDGNRGNRVAKEIKRRSLTPTIGQTPCLHLAGTKRGTQVWRKERGCRGLWLSGADRRRTGDQLRGQRGADRRDAPPVRRSVHSFHSSILRSRDVSHNGTLGPSVDHLPERRTEHKWRRCANRGAATSQRSTKEIPRD